MRGDIVMTLTAQGTGTVVSSVFANSGEAGVVMAALHVSAVGGTPSAVLTVEESATGQGSWTAVAGGTAAALAAAGSAVAVVVPTKSYVRLSVAVSGTTPSVTGSGVALVFTD